MSALFKGRKPASGPPASERWTIEEITRDGVAELVAHPEGETDWLEARPVFHSREAVEFYVTSQGGTLE